MSNCHIINVASCVDFLETTKVGCWPLRKMLTAWTVSDQNVLMLNSAAILMSWIPALMIQSFQISSLVYEIFTGPPPPPHTYTPSHFANFSLCSCLLPLANIFLFMSINLDQSYGKIGRPAVGKTNVPLRVKSNVLIQCQASKLRSNPQTFISPLWAISGGIRGPKETKKLMNWINLPSCDG